jgi:hypothetical protein
VVNITLLPLYPREGAPGTHWIESWVDPRAGLEEVGKRKSLTIPGLELRSLGRPAHSQSLCRMRYPDISFSIGKAICIVVVNIRFLKFCKILAHQHRNVTFFLHCPGSHCFYCTYKYVLVLTVMVQSQSQQNLHSYFAHSHYLNHDTVG